MSDLEELKGQTRSWLEKHIWPLTFWALAAVLTLVILLAIGIFRL